jgi:hypothetical protein
LTGGDLRRSADNPASGITLTKKWNDTMNHLESKDIRNFVLALDENMTVTCAAGDLDHYEIRNRLMQSIVEHLNYSIAGHSGIYEDWIEMSVAKHEHEPAITISQAASLIRYVWEYKERQCNEAAITKKGMTP